MSVQSSLIKELVESLTNLQASSYTCGAAMTVMFYDFLLTFPDEVQYVWGGDNKRLNATKLMFLWNRYFVIPWVLLSNYHLAYGLRGPVSNTFCKVEIVSVALVQGLSMTIGIQLLALRVLALYRNNRIVRYGLYTWIAACSITLYVIVIIAMKRFVPQLIYLPFTHTCYTVADPIIGGVYIPPILAEAAILILQVVNHYQQKRRDVTFKTPLVTALYRDGYLYFSLVMSIRLLCIFIYAFAPASLWFVANQMDFPLTAALISRFFIQLRSAAVDHEQSLTTGQFSHNLSRTGGPTVSFGSRRRFSTIQNDKEAWQHDSVLPLQELRRMRPGRV